MPIGVRRGPLAFVPINDGTVAVVPTADVNLPPADELTTVTSPRSGDEWAAFPLQNQNDNPTGSVRSEPPRPPLRGPYRPRSRTLASILGSRGDNPETALQLRNAAGEEIPQPPPRKRGESGPTRPRPQSWVADSLMHGPTIRTGSLRGASLDMPASPLSMGGGDIALTSSKGRRDSVLSSDSAAVNVRVPTDALEGRVGSSFSLPRDGVAARKGTVEVDLHHPEVVEALEVIDAHIATVSHLSNVANSILVPPLSFYSRKPIISLPAPPAAKTRPDVERGEDSEEDELDRHVEDVLGKRAKVRRALQGLWAYLKTPIGILMGIYGFLVVFWGAAIVLFLGKLINLQNDDLQGLWVEISCQIVNGLFTIQGVGFIPWRALDTYYICRIWSFRRLSRRLRKKANLPPLGDKDDLPTEEHGEHVQVLTEAQQKELITLQEKFVKSQSWYRPHVTATHKAFSINTALLICLLVDFNSVFQCMLCGIMWGMNRFNRPGWATGALVGLSFSCGIGAGILIWYGGERSKKTKEVEERLRQALEAEQEVLHERYGVPRPTDGVSPVTEEVQIDEEMLIPETKRG